MREQTYVVLLTLSYAMLASLHLVLLMTLNVRRAVKATAVVAMTSVYLATFYCTQGLLGWSAAIAVPDRFKVIATRIVEPDAVHARTGAIHLWLEGLDDRNIPSGVPRAFVLPYSPQLAAKVADADAEIKKGNAQGGTANIFNSSFASETPDSANVRAVTKGASLGGDPSGGGLLDPAALGGQSKSIDLIPLPPPLLPAKDDPQ